MKYVLLAAFVLIVVFMAKNKTVAQDATMPTINPHLTAPYYNTDGTTETLSQHKGKVLLLVNTASACGFTPQYEGLEALYQKYKGEGFVVIAFPSNDFGGQEPGTDEEIAAFCSTKFNVTFPIKAKMSTKGDTKSPLYVGLTGPGASFPGEVGWNFEKFLIDRDGVVIGRYKSRVKPDSDELKSAIEAAIAR